MLASSRSVRVYTALLLVGVLVTLTLLSCSGLATEQAPGSPPPAATRTETLLFYAMTPTVTPPIIEFQDLKPGETPAVVRGIINSSSATLKVYAGPGSGFPALADLNHRMVVDVIGKSQGGWLYISDSYPHSELRGWVDEEYILMEENDASKIGLVQIVTPTIPPFLP